MKYIKFFETYGGRIPKLKKEFSSLFYRKICEYGDVVGKNFVDRGDYEIEFYESTHSDGRYTFDIIIKDEIDEIFLIIKTSPFNESVYYNTIVDYLDDSEFFEKREMYQYENKKATNNKYKIIGTSKEVEEDIKDLETRVQANKYNL